MRAPENIVQLLERYLSGEASATERAIVDAWYYSNLPEGEVFVPDAEHEIVLRMKKRLEESMRQNRVVRRWQRATMFKAAAAVLIILLGTALYMLRSPDKDNGITAVPQNEPASVAAGSGRALLTLADGTVIELDNTASGLLTEQGAARVVKLDGSRLQYHAGDGAATEPVLYNYISTPPGSQYQVTLADQTKVWLNASSSIRFPTAFRGAVRDIEIVGEAYFEVAHDPEKNFRVKVNDSYIRVFGTRFNVMAYENENTILTTLLEGSLSVENETSSELLKPGQQARLSKNGSIAVLTNVNPSEVLAWKNGKFLFNSLDMPAIMRQLERWYDIEVSYEGRPEVHFTGQLDRNLEVSQILRKLELTREVRFRMEGKKITVLAPGN